MTNKNEFDTPDNFSTNDHVFYGDEKKGKDDFDQSEPEFLISVMDRHDDWATVVCLI